MRHLSPLVIFALLGCGSTATEVGSPTVDSGGGAMPEASPPATPDATPDAMADVTPDVTPGTDARDASAESAVDATPEARPEASPEASPDATATDATADVQPDHRDATFPADATVTIPGLVAQYDFEDPQNLGRDDVARTDSTEIYNATQTAGHIGSAISFRGGYLMLPGIQKFQLAAGGDFSLELWLKTPERFSTNLTNLHVLTCATSTTHTWGLAQLSPHVAAQFMVNGSEAALGKTDVYDGAWHHVVGTRSGQTVKVYVDGKLEGTTVSTMPIVDRGCTIALGRDGACCQNFTGSFDRVRLWQKALTDGEVAGLAGE